MILDTGVCSVFREGNVALSGRMPVRAWVRIGRSWYKELDFSTSPTWESEGRQETRTDQRVRILQMRGIRKGDHVVLADTEEYPGSEALPIYRITRAWHGKDDDGPDLITDLTLEEVSP